MPQACPGCGREYRRKDKLCPCGYAERALRFAGRDVSLPEIYVHQREHARLVREQIERLRVLERERVRAERRKLDELVEQQIRAAKPAKPAEPPPPIPPPIPKPKKPKPAERLRLEARRTPSPEAVRRSWDRIALTRHLSAESRFYQQRTEAAHRNFTKLLERVAPSEETTGDWPEPLEMGRTLGVHHYPGKVM